MQDLRSNSHRIGMDLLLGAIQAELDPGDVMAVHPDVGIVWLVLVLAADPIDPRGAGRNEGAVVRAVTDLHDGRLSLPGLDGRKAFCEVAAEVQIHVRRIR